MFAAGKLKAGRIWRQESVTGSIFEGSITLGSDGAIFPHIKGSAFVNADATLIFDEKDPFVHGIRTS